MKKTGLVTLTSSGFYCAQGDFYIDPWRPVKRAVLTHAHSDHAYRGSKSYLTAADGELLVRIRLDAGSKIETIDYGKTLTMDGVKISLHPAGHILGSAQVRIEYKGQVWVVSGDFKLTSDATCRPYEVIKCNYFISEATFGLPIYRWPPNQQVFEEINGWWLRNKDRGKASVLFAYALGKSQRVMSGIDASIGPIFTHGAVERLTEAYRQTGIGLPATQYAGSVTNKKDFVGSLIIAPPSSQQAVGWLRRFGTHSTGFASGWMMVRGARRQRAVDRGFVLSDHADWTELLSAIRASEAETVYVTHGFAPEVVRYLKETGQQAEVVKTRFVGDQSQELPDEESETH